MSAIESVRVSTQTLLQELLECGTVHVKMMPMGQNGTWEGFISRQTTLEEFYPESFPGTLGKEMKGAPEITIHLNTILIKAPQELGEALHDMCQYIRDINGQEMCMWDS